MYFGVFVIISVEINVRGVSLEMCKKGFCIYKAGSPQKLIIYYLCHYQYFQKVSLIPQLLQLSNITQSNLLKQPPLKINHLETAHDIIYIKLNL